MLTTKIGKELRPRPGGAGDGVDAGAQCLPWVQGDPCDWPDPDASRGQEGKHKAPLLNDVPAECVAMMHPMATRTSTRPPPFPASTPCPYNRTGADVVCHDLIRLSKFIIVPPH